MYEQLEALRACKHPAAQAVNQTGVLRATCNHCCRCERLETRQKAVQNAWCSYGLADARDAAVPHQEASPVCTHIKAPKLVMFMMDNCMYRLELDYACSWL